MHAQPCLLPRHIEQLLELIWAVRARANPLSLGVRHFTLRFVLPRSWVGYPSRSPKGFGMQSPLGPKVYPKVRVEWRRKEASWRTQHCLYRSYSVVFALVSTWAHKRTS